MNILIDCPLSDEQAAILRGLSPEVHLEFAPSNNGLELPPRAVADAEIIYTTSAAFDPAAAPHLAWVQTNTAAVNHLMVQPIWNSAIPIANVSGAYSVAVAECALAMLLALSRKIPTAVAMQCQHGWDEAATQGVDLHGKTIGIVGYGSIGRQIGRLANALGMGVLACKRRPDQHRDDGYLIPGTGDPQGLFPAAWFGIDDLAEMLPQCDIALVTLPLTADTRHIIGQREMELLPRHACVMNVGRGPVLDEAALIEALRNGTVAAAALDVFETEPLPGDSPLWDMPNVLIMPHIASWTTAQPLRAAEVLIENVRRHLSDLPLVNVVDRKFMY